MKSRVRSQHLSKKKKRMVWCPFPTCACNDYVTTVTGQLVSMGGRDVQMTRQTHNQNHHSNHSDCAMSGAFAEEDLFAIRGQHEERRDTSSAASLQVDTERVEVRDKARKSKKTANAPKNSTCARWRQHQLWQSVVPQQIHDPGHQRVRKKQNRMWAQVACPASPVPPELPHAWV